MTMTATSLATFASGLTLTGGSGGAGKIVYDATNYGVIHMAKASSIYDWSLWEKTGSTVAAAIAAGAATIQFPSGVSGNVAFTGSPTIAGVLTQSSGASAISIGFNSGATPQIYGNATGQAIYAADEHRFFSKSVGTEWWEITSSGHLFAAVDNTYDIGAVGATRPRNLYVAGTGVFGGVGTFNGNHLTVNSTAAAAYVEASSPSGQFAQILLTQASNAQWTLNNTATTGLFTITEAGVNNWLAIAKTSGAVRMASYGAGAATFDASGNITSVSDERHKADITLFTLGLSALRGIRPISHRYNELSGLETTHTYLGFSAQNVREHLPGAVFENAGGMLSLYDRGIMAATVNAVNELDARVSRLEARAA